ncbi:MAG: ATP-binding protein [Planctomycetota bacterium]
MILFLTSDADCKVLSQASHFSGQTFVAVCVTALGIVGVVLLWNRALRREVARRESRLAEMTAHMHTAIEAMPEGILILDRRDRVVWANHQFKKQFGLKLQPGTPVNKSNRWKLFQCFESPTTAEKLWLESIRDHDFRHSQEMRMAEHHATVQLKTHPIVSNEGDWAGRLWVFEDVTVRNRMHAELLQVHRAEAIGHLSGGLAHEFNNFLTVIRSNLELLATSSDPVTAFEVDRDECLATARIAVDRAAEVTRKLLGFARGVKLNRQPTDLKGIVTEACDLVRGSLRHVAEFRVETHGPGLWADVDRQLIEQAIINLCLNARDSIEGRDGRVCVSLSSHHHPESGEMARISVSDNGCGMPPEIIRHATEPFFTTKEIGHGTGLGLSLVEGVIQQHGGHIAYDSHDGVGTTIHLLLPLMPSDIDAKNVIGTPAVATAQGLRLLVVDDEPLVRTSAAQLLRQHDHEVALAANGMDAISMIASEGPFDVVLMDLTMPELSGVETYYEILSAWPDQKVVFCTGYYKDLSEVLPNPDEYSPPLLKKPFSIKQLSTVLADVMARSSKTDQRDANAKMDSHMV